MGKKLSNRKQLNYQEFWWVLLGLWLYTVLVHIQIDLAIEEYHYIRQEYQTSSQTPIFNDNINLLDYQTKEEILQKFYYKTNNIMKN